MTAIEIFCRQVRTRSSDHHQAFGLLFSNRIYSQCVAVLRQELDSMIRVIYLLSISDIGRRNTLIETAIGEQGMRDIGKNQRITDKEMVELASSLQGWTRSVYRFGCAFIHLSGFHDYQARDPLTMIDEDERKAILEHMRYYHGGPHQDNPTYNDLIPTYQQCSIKLQAISNAMSRNLKMENPLIPKIHQWLLPHQLVQDGQPIGGIVQGGGHGHR